MNRYASTHIEQIRLLSKPYLVKFSSNFFSRKNLRPKKYMHPTLKIYILYALSTYTFWQPGKEEYTSYTVLTKYARATVE